MELTTTRFGAIEIDPDSIITFTQPIIGFQEYRRFVLLPGPGEGLLKWLQSTDSGELAFLLLDPNQVVSDYEVTVNASDLKELAASGLDDLEVYTLVVVPEDPSQIRTNLKAPLLLNPKHRLGKQTVLEKSDYPVQHYLSRKTPVEQMAAGGQ